MFRGRLIVLAIRVKILDPLAMRFFIVLLLCILPSVAWADIPGPGPRPHPATGQGGQSVVPAPTGEGVTDSGSGCSAYALDDMLLLILLSMAMATRSANRVSYVGIRA